jgi:hypothetical protein
MSTPFRKKIFLFFFQKAIDTLLSMCYNVYIKRKESNPWQSSTTEKIRPIMQK